MLHPWPHVWGQPQPAGSRWPSLISMQIKSTDRQASELCLKSDPNMQICCLTRDLLKLKQVYWYQNMLTIRVMKFKDNRDCRICGMKLLRSKMNNLADWRPFLVSPRDGGGWLWLEMVETGYKIVVWVWHSPIVIPQPIPALAYLAVLLGIYSDAILASLSPLVLLQIHVDMQPQLAYHQHTDTIRTQLVTE